jgi:hypothetical protein
MSLDFVHTVRQSGSNSYALLLLSSPKCVETGCD